MDLGKEIIGSIRLTVDSPKQQTVTLLYGEEKNNDGTVTVSYTHLVKRYAAMPGNKKARGFRMGKSKQERPAG